MGRIDLNEARQKRRAERGGDDNELVVGSDVYPLPAELPIAVLEHVIGAQAGDLGQMSNVFAVMLGGEDTYEELKAKHGLTVDDLMEILDQTLDVYGVAVPESPASPPSSTATSTPLRPTSSASTAPTSDEQSSPATTP